VDRPKLKAEGSKLKAEGSKLKAEGSKLNGKSFMVESEKVRRIWQSAERRAQSVEGQRIGSEG